MKRQESIDALRLSVVEAFINTRNVELLQRAMDLIQEESKSEKIVGYEPDGTPISAAQLKKDVVEAIKEADNGDLISAEELEAEVETWE